MHFLQMRQGFKEILCIYLLRGDILYIIKAKAAKLDGPKVLGKIELPVERPKKKPVASSEGEGRKKNHLKRTRKMRRRKRSAFHHALPPVRGRVSNKTRGD